MESEGKMIVGTVQRTVTVAITREDLRYDLEEALQAWRDSTGADDVDILCHYVAAVLGRPWVEIMGDKEYQATIAAWQNNGANVEELADHLMAFCEVATGMVTADTLVTIEPRRKERAR